MNSPYPTDQDPVRLQELILEMARTIRNTNTDKHLVALVDSVFDSLSVDEITAELKALNDGYKFQEIISVESENSRKFTKLYDLVGNLLQQVEISDYRNEEAIELKSNKAFVDIAFFYEFPDVEIGD